VRRTDDDIPLQVEDSMSGGEASDGNGCWQKFQQRFNEIVRDVIRFAKFIPGFTELDLNNQISLLKGAGFEVCRITLLLKSCGRVFVKSGY